MIRNLLFDFGDVWLDLDKGKLQAGMTQYGLSSTDGTLNKLSQRYETGAISTPSFLNAVSDYLNEADKEKIISYWNALIGGFPQPRLDFLKGLKRSAAYRLFLISNTNELHIKRVKEVMGEENYGAFQDCFEGFYLSHELGMRKPDPEVFRFILGQHGLKASETLFVDDTFEHIRAASKLGIKTWHLKAGSEDILELHKKI
ncbi:HAD family hydrolase [Robiginitalea sp. IMCC43444]|uniref:HAD family hydrolase n=1 Tax=Robiginitalea sp. IMCC43444 TaxID=3459121 RepID=UPI004040EE5F